VKFQGEREEGLRGAQPPPVLTGYLLTGRNGYGRREPLWLVKESKDEGDERNTSIRKGGEMIMKKG